jgi:predicted MFS family arabinose efflux permease
MRLLWAVFCPFAVGYFLSFFFRNVNALISKDLARDFALAPSDLGFLTATYLLTFAAFQLPLGVLLDRYGPRRVVATLLCVAAAGALVFARAQDFAGLSVGRALIGLGVSAGLMGALKAFTLWFPPSRLATLNGLFLAVGGLGALSATSPAEALIEPFGWRALFTGLSALTLGTAALVFFSVPEKPLPGAGEPLRVQVAVYARIFSSAGFWRIVLPLVTCLSSYQALQSLWLGPWLYDVAGASRHAVGQYLLVGALAYTAGSALFGIAADRLARHGVPRMTLFKIGFVAALAMLGLLTAQVTAALGTILFVYGFTAISMALAYPQLTGLFPHAMSARVMTACNTVNFFCAFVFQWGIGAVLRLYPVAGGNYAPAGYTAAFLVLAGLQLATLAWLLSTREKR